ncbi:MAG TPA: tRNA pseudouridine(38-40) synthase TruA [Chryseosolibacter sp.]|nr:tRNA pseudouridine(38-40) synthase TruA [Chryseosolibacter sp.]
MRYFFHIGYQGTAYRGWQKFPDINSVQNTIEQTLEKVLKLKTPIIGCGRTDAGVHAAQFYFHADIEKTIDFDLKWRLNQNLPADISVFDVFEVSDERHARFDAISRSYDYFIHVEKDPFLCQYSTFYDVPDLNYASMHDAVALLMLYDDYKSFCKTPAKYRTTICEITKAALFVGERGRLRFHISANRFLSGMIRVIVGHLVQIGRGDMTKDEFESMLITKAPSPNVARAPAQGLYLSSVVYPYVSLPPRTDFVPMLSR